MTIGQCTNVPHAVHLVKLNFNFSGARRHREDASPNEPPPIAVKMRFHLAPLLAACVAAVTARGAVVKTWEGDEQDTPEPAWPQPRRLSTEPTAPRVRYLVRTDPWTDAGWAAKMAAAAPLAASYVDDTPMSLTTLNGTAPVLAKRRGHAWVNPNGALFFSPKPPCHGFFATDSCALETEDDWRGCVAVYAADLNPGFDTSKISSSSEGTSVLAVRWHNASLYGQSQRRVTVGVEVFGDGRITIIHERVVEAVPGTLVVGLRFDGGERVAATPDQLLRAAAWRTAGAGAYAGSPPRSSSKITVCPVPEDWCGDVARRRRPRRWRGMSRHRRDSVPFIHSARRRRGPAPSPRRDPGVGGPTQVAAPSSTITLRAPFFGCAAEAAFDFSCAFDGTIDTFTEAAFAFVDGSDGPVEVTCQAPSVEGSYVVELRYATPLNDDDGGAGDGGEATASLGERRVIFRRPVLVDVVREDDEAGVGDLYGASSCAWCGRVLCFAGDCSGHCDAGRCEGWCDVCGEDNAFVAEACDGSCASSSFEDEAGLCCDVVAADCLGRCPSSDLPAFEGSVGNATVCCLQDCQGGCYGAARFDRCGVCEGHNRDEDACGTCFGNATQAECPAAPEEAHRGRKRRRSGLARSVKSHPLLAAFVAAELVATSLCLIFCATQRNARRGAAGAPLDFGPTPYSRLARADLEVLVDDHLEHPQSPPPDTPAQRQFKPASGFRRPSFPSPRLLGGLALLARRRRLQRWTTEDGRPVPRTRPRASVFRRAYRRAFRSMRRRRALTEAVQAPPVTTQRQPRNADVVRRVAQAYEAAVAQLVDTAAPAPEAQSEEVCAICLDNFEDDDVVQLPDCQHAFHADCLQPWLRQRNTCPLCKQNAISRVYPKPPDACSRLRQSAIELRATQRSRTRGGASGSWSSPRT